MELVTKGINLSEIVWELEDKFKRMCEKLGGRLERSREFEEESFVCYLPEETEFSVRIETLSDGSKSIFITGERDGEKAFMDVKTPENFYPQAHTEFPETCAILDKGGSFYNPRVRKIKMSLSRGFGIGGVAFWFE